MSGAFVPKSRRPRFELNLRILDLNNVPLASGTSCIKWHLPHSTAAEHRGKTNKCSIRDHRVSYDYERTIVLRLTIGKDGMLQECIIQFEVMQEYGSSGAGERIRLGYIKVNLAEYVETGEMSPTSPGANAGQGGIDGERGIVRRYLMQESKINSTLKLGIYMKQVEGSRDYTAPALRSAPVFGGIAGIISSSEPVPSAVAAASYNQSETAVEEGAMPSLSTSSREVGEMQDVYRRTLAAYWMSLPGELRADDCIEEIFAGRDGWGKSHKKDWDEHNNHHASSADGDATPLASGMERPRSSKLHFGGHSRHGSKASGKLRLHGSGGSEINESDIREDLRSWNVDSTVAA